jgi:D-alanyl-D-alanine carboxypeptidase (penicillin-binding protein 5/6)
MEKYKQSPEKTKITVSRTAASINGTSANLKDGDEFTVLQLFYGLMLPSGNDAAYALAEHFGYQVATH